MTTSDEPTNGTDREAEALPAGGPVDPVFPPNTPAYELLAAGRCAGLKDQVGAWGPEVVDVEGADTVELYRSAAHVCLGEWDQAIEAFGHISTPPGLGDSCARESVFAWLQPLIEARKADPGFEPEFVPSGEASGCPAEDATEDTGTNDEDQDDQPTDEDVGEDDDVQPTVEVTDGDGP